MAYTLFRPAVLTSMYVGSEPDEVVGYDATSEDGYEITIKNTSQGTVYLGFNSNVSVTDGYRLRPEESVTINVPPGQRETVDQIVTGFAPSPEPTYVSIFTQPHWDWVA